MEKLLTSSGNEAMELGKKWCRKIHYVWETNLHQVVERDAWQKNGIRTYCIIIVEWSGLTRTLKHLATHDTQEAASNQENRTRTIETRVWLCISHFNEWYGEKTSHGLFFLLTRQFRRAIPKYRNRLHQWISPFCLVRYIFSFGITSILS